MDCGGYVTHNCDREKILSRVRKFIDKRSSNSTTNIEILSKPLELNEIIRDIVESVKAIDSDTVKYEDTINVNVLYKKFSERTLYNESIHCNSRPFVTNCIVDVPRSLRDLKFTLYEYEYDVVFGGANITELSYAISNETVGATTVPDMNISVTSDQILYSNASDVDIETFDTQYNFVDDGIFSTQYSSMPVVDVLAPPPPPPSSESTGGSGLSVYAHVGMVAGAMVFVGIVASVFVGSYYRKASRRAPPPSPLLTSGESSPRESMVFSTNPLHNE